jgi:peptidoglycan/LPS O-acetylase OafA/YrhL
LSAATPPPRNLQLDGWRALAVLGVMWFHWTPASWRGAVPFEIGLFFLLTLTGFLITRILLREKAMGEKLGGAWRLSAYKRFQERRALRLLVPCLAAMIFAYALGAPDIRAHPFLYLGQIVNFHMALMREHPDGTPHYWTLAIQQQIYLLWPLLILWTPRKWLLPALGMLLLVGPVSRAIAFRIPEVIYPGLLTPCAMDYFAIGGLLAYAMEKGLKPGDPRVSWIGWSALLPYVLLYLIDRGEHPVAGAQHVQQTLLAVVCAGVISATLAGFRGVLAKVLLHPWIQSIAKLSYGLYLFHVPMPLLVGKVMPFLWSAENGWMVVARIVAYSAFSWGAAWLCWRYLEQPLERLKAKIPMAPALPKDAGGFS